MRRIPNRCRCIELSAAFAALFTSSCYFPSLGPPTPCSPARMCAAVKSTPSDQCAVAGSGKGVMLQAANLNPNYGLLATFDETVVHPDGSTTDSGRQKPIAIEPKKTADLGCEFVPNGSGGPPDQHQFQAVHACFASHDPTCAGLVPAEPSPTITECRSKCDSDRCVEYPTKYSAVIRLSWANAVPPARTAAASVLHDHPPVKIDLDPIVSSACPNRGPLNFRSDGTFDEFGDSCVGAVALAIGRYNTLGITIDPELRGTYKRTGNTARLTLDGSNPERGGIWLQWFGAMAGKVYADSVQGVSEIDISESQIKVIGAQRCIWLDLVK